jgi:transcriptional regulator with XRE-family HTH domain
MAGKFASHDRNVGARLRLRRKQLAITHHQLAELLGVAAEEIAKCECGTKRLGAVRLARASQVLDAPIGYFFAGLAAVNLPEPDTPSGEPLLAIPGAAELLSAYRRIASPQLRASILKLVRQLAHEGRGCVSPTLANASSRSHHSTSQAR